MTTAAAANDEKTLSAMVQAVLDAAPLQKYMHPEAAGRKPLTVVTSHGLTGLTKFGLPVKLAAKAEPNQPALELTRLDHKGTRGHVTFEYAVEGLAGTFALTQDAGGKWSVDKHEFRER